MRHKPKHLSYNYNKITQWFVKPRLVLSSVCLLLTLPVDLFIFLRGQVNVLRDLCRAEMRSTGPFCAFTSAAKLLPTRSCFWEVPGKQRLAGEDNPTSQYLKNFLQTTRARKPSPNLGYVPRCSTRAFWAGRTNSWWKTKLLFKSCRLNTNSQSLKHQFRRELDVGWWLFQAISSILSWTPRGVAQTRETQQEEEDGARISA